MVHCVSDSRRTCTDAQTRTALTGFQSRPSAGCIYISCRLRESKMKKIYIVDAASFSHQAPFIMQRHKLLPCKLKYVFVWFVLCKVQSKATLSPKNLLHKNFDYLLPIKFRRKPFCKSLHQKIFPSLWTELNRFFCVRACENLKLTHHFNSNSYFISSDIFNLPKMSVVNFTEYNLFFLFPKQWICAPPCITRRCHPAENITSINSQAFEMKSNR